MQPSPAGAQCALHFGSPASFVCARCGNFMCASCAGEGKLDQCPSCRDLSPAGYPFGAEAPLGTHWAHLIAAFQRDLAMILVATVVFLAMVIGGAFIANVLSTILNAVLGLATDPAHLFSNLKVLAVTILVGQVVNVIVNVGVQGVALVGFYRLLMDVLVGKRADVARMFSQLHLLPQYLLLYVIKFFIITVPMYVALLGMGLLAVRIIGLDWDRLSDFRPEQLLNPALAGLALGGAVFLTVASVFVLPITLFSIPELLEGNCGAVEALKRAWALGEGQRLRAAGYSLLSGLCAVAGVVACCVGVVAGLPIGLMLVLSLFLALRRSSPLQSASPTAPQHSLT